VPPPVVEAFLLKEDRWFYWHPGLNPFALTRAAGRTYVTRSARQRLASTPIPGKPIPAARAFDAASSLEILRLIVSANLKAMRTP